MKPVFAIEYTGTAGGKVFLIMSEGFRDGDFFLLLLGHSEATT